MAPFVPYGSIANPPSYLGLSKEPDRLRPDPSGKIIGEGLADLFSTAISGVDEINQANIRKDAYKNVDAEVAADVGRMENTIIQMGGGATTTAPSGIQSTPNPTSPRGLLGFAEETVPTTLVGEAPNSPFYGIGKVPKDTPVEELPIPVQRGINEANRLAQAASLKKVEDVDFTGRIWERTQNLISTYGDGYRDVIEHNMSAALGSRGAAYRTALKNALDNLANKQNAADKEYLNDLEKNAALFTPQDYQFFRTTQDPAMRQQAYFYIQKQQYVRAVAADEDLDLKRKKARNEDTEDDNRRALNTQVNSILEQGVNKMRFTMGDRSFNLPVLDKVIKDQFNNPGGGPVNRELLAQAGQQLGLAKALMEQQFDKYVIENGIAGKIKKEELDAARARIGGFLQPLIDQVGEGNTKMITNELNTLDGITKNAGLGLLKDQNIRTMAGLDKALGGTMQAIGTDLINTAVTTRDGKQVPLINQMAQSVYKMTNDAMMATNKNSLYTYLENYKLVDPKATTLPSGLLPKVLQTPEQILNHPSATPEIKANVTATLSNPDNVKVIKAIAADSQVQGFATAYSPKTTEKVFEATQGTGDWEKFKETAGLSFREAFTNTIGYLDKKIQADAGRFTLKWNQEQGVLEYSNPLRDQALPGAIPADVTRREIDKLNVGLKAIGKIYEMEGKKLTPEVLKQELGITFDPNYRSGLVRAIQYAIDPNAAINSQEGANSGTTPKQPGTPLPGNIEQGTSGAPNANTGPSKGKGAELRGLDLGSNPQTRGLGLTESQQKSIIGAANTAVPGPVWGDPSAPDFFQKHIVKVSTSDGKEVSVNKYAAEAFQGFIHDLEATGYQIKSIGGYADRPKRGGTSLSQHAFGNAIDINPAKNPFLKGSQATVSDMPANISQLAAKWGLSWGGDWTSVKDAMHFEYTGIDKEKPVS